MKVEVFILTVVRDDAGKVIAETRAPVPQGGQSATPRAPMPGSAEAAYAPPVETVMPPHPPMDRPSTAPPPTMLPVPVPLPQPKLPPQPLTETDPDVLAVFSGEFGGRVTHGPVARSAPAGPVVEMTAARARAMGVNVPPGGPNTTGAALMAGGDDMDDDDDDAARAA